MPRDGSGIYHVPAGTYGIPDRTVESLRYNVNVDDVAACLNAPTPVVAGGTGGQTAAEARDNLDAERSMQTVVDFDSHVWEPGSMIAAPGANSAPVAGHWFIGTYYGDTGNSTLQVRDIGTPAPFVTYIRVRSGGVWSAWALDGADKVNKSGDTISGNLLIDQGGLFISHDNWPQLTINTTDTTTGNAILGGRSSKARWDIKLGDSAAETGSNTGSNFSISRYNDDGTFLSTPLSINRASGMTFHATNVMLYSGGGTSPAVGFSVSGFSDWYIDHASGSLRFINGNTNLQLDINGDCSARGKLFFNYSAGLTQFLAADSSSTAFAMYTFSNRFEYVRATNDFSWVQNDLWRMALHSNGNLLIAGNGLKPGGGTWADSSDARIKNVLGDYTRGLDDIMALRPVTYSFKGNDTSSPPSEQSAPYSSSPHHQVAVDGQQFTGLVAQEVEWIFPEMVTKRIGYIDNTQVTDIRDLDTAPLIFALVNAIKELKAQIETIQTRLNKPTKGIDEI